MRLFQLLLFACIVTHTFGQQTKSDVSSSRVCALPMSCVAIVGDQPFKPFKTSGPYIGSVIFVATLDTCTMQLIKYKLVFADLYQKTDTTKRIEVRWKNRSGDVKYLDTLSPHLINHLKEIKFRLIKCEGCVMKTEWNLPINIK